jgi:PAS domain S-box-containing protein
LKEYERAVEGVEEMIAVVDRKYQYVIANDKFLKMRNMTKGQVVEHFAHEVLNEGVFDTVVKEKLDECFQGKVVRYEMKYTYPAFGERDILVSYFPIEGPAGVDRAACIVQDITERKLMEQALRSMNQKLIEAHEEERTRIARELHDDIGQRLALLMWKLGRLGSDVQNLPPESRKAVVEAREDVSQLVRDIQAMSHRLHSSKLEYFGLVRAAVIYCSELSDQHKVEIDVRSENVLDDLPQEIALCIFRVLQEALQNAIKHSRSQRFDVSFSRTQVEICLTVYDSGIGFDPLEAIKGRGVGLVSMKERLNLVGGKLSIESQPGKGTTIRAYVPLIPRTKTARAE